MGQGEFRTTRSSRPASISPQEHVGTPRRTLPHFFRRAHAGQAESDFRRHAALPQADQILRRAVSVVHAQFAPLRGRCDDAGQRRAHPPRTGGVETFRQRLISRAELRAANAPWCRCPSPIRRQAGQCQRRPTARATRHPEATSSARRSSGPRSPARLSRTTSPCHGNDCTPSFSKHGRVTRPPPSSPDRTAGWRTAHARP